MEHHHLIIWTHLMYRLPGEQQQQQKTHPPPTTTTTTFGLDLLHGSEVQIFCIGHHTLALKYGIKPFPSLLLRESLGLELTSGGAIEFYFKFLFW